METNITTPDSEATPLVIPKGVDDNEFSLSDLYSPKSKYPPEQKLRAVAAYVTYGDWKKAEKLSGVKWETIRWWQRDATWWPSALAECRKQMNDKLDAAYGRVIDIAVGNVEDALKNGEEMFDRNGKPILDENGNQRRKKVSASAQAIIAATFQDKRQILRGEPTSIAAKSQMDVINDIAKRMEKISEQFTRAEQRENRKIVN